VTDTLVTNAKAAITLQAALEKAWLNAWYSERYWFTAEKELTASAVDAGHVTSGSWTDKIALIVSVLQDPSTVDVDTVAGATAFATAADTSHGDAIAALDGLEAATLAADATRSELGKRIVRATKEIIALQALVTGNNDGALDLAKIRRNAEATAFSNANTLSEATAEEAAAQLAVKDFDEDIEGNDVADSNGQLHKDVATAAAALIAKQGLEDDAQGALDGAEAFTGEGALTLTQLRTAVTEATAAWVEKDGDLDGYMTTLGNLEDRHEAAELALKAAEMACQVKSYDAFRTTLENAMIDRAQKLEEIRKLVEAEEEAAPKKGQAGSRCEKALSNGTWRPKRTLNACDEGLCCGSARVWMEAGDGAQDAAWRTIETCQETNEEGNPMTYAYQPPRPPMATEMPAKIVVPFMCIEGAKKLAAAASAVAAAVYMLA
jgi:hypothetical protein